MVHTPGPWELRDVEGAGLEIHAPVHLVNLVDWPPVRKPDKPAMVYSLTGPAGHKLIACERWVQFEPNGWHAMQEANGRLIAAAPDLLKACELVSLWMVAKCPSPHSDSQLLEVVNGAISKAKFGV